MGNGYSDEVYRGLPRGETRRSLDELLYDDRTSPKKYTKTMSISMTPDMYQAVQELVGKPALPFEGNMSSAGRHAIGVFLEACQKFLSDDGSSLFSALIRQQRRLTRERYIVTIEDALNQEVDLLRFWTSRNKWNEIVRGLTKFAGEIEDYPVAEWREYAAGIYLHNEGLRSLVRVWEEHMREDSPESWRRVREVHAKMEAIAGVG